jgi:predicted DNA-binding transcriptional regulator AlpA
VRILRTIEVAALTGLSRTTIWRLERAGQFPKRLQLSRNRVGWLETDLEQWIESRPQATSDTGCTGE